MVDCDFSKDGVAIFAMRKGLLVSLPGKQLVPPDTVVYLNNLYYLTAGTEGL